MLAYQQNDPEATCELLLPLRQHAHAIGGSHAQRDVINLTLMEAALRYVYVVRKLVLHRFATGRSFDMS